MKRRKRGWLEMDYFSYAIQCYTTLAKMGTDEEAHYQETCTDQTARVAQYVTDLWTGLWKYGCERNVFYFFDFALWRCFVSIHLNISMAKCLGVEKLSSNLLEYFAKEERQLWLYATRVFSDGGKTSNRFLFFFL